MQPIVSEELISGQPPEAQEIIRVLLAENIALRSELEELRRQIKGATPQNSSLPPSTQHPHAKPKPAGASRNASAAANQVTRSTIVR